MLLIFLLSLLKVKVLSSIFCLIKKKKRKKEKTFKMMHTSLLSFIKTHQNSLFTYLMISVIDLWFVDLQEL